jgi:hypothetical protein
VYYLRAIGVVATPMLGLADVTHVRVLGTTATQAVIAYTAPDNQACTIAASLSPSYSPLVADVDPTHFTGANSDGRPGSISLGRARIFVLGTRNVERDANSTPVSRALQAATTYYYRITCPSVPVHIRRPAAWSTTASGTLVTSTIPAGLGYGDSIPIDPAGNGAYLSPSLSATDRTASTVDPHTGAAVKNLTLFGDYPGTTDFGMVNTSGIGYQCHPTPVKASGEDKYGYHCAFIAHWGSSYIPVLYWIASDGEVRNLGPMVSNYTSDYNLSICSGYLSAPFDYASSPNVFYCVATPPNQYGVPFLVKATYKGHDSPGQDRDLTGLNPVALSGTPNTSYSIVNPAPRDLVTLLSEFDPNYRQYSGPMRMAFRQGDWWNGKYVFYSWAGNQDTFGWIGVFDVNRTPIQQQAQFGSSAGCVDNAALTGGAYSGRTGCIVASTGTFTGGMGSNLRWSVLHTVDITPASNLIPATLNVLSQKQSGVDYRVTLGSPLSVTTSPCTKEQPGGNYLPYWPSPAWNAGCSTITVSGEPALVGTWPGYPASLAALPGDLLSAQTSDYIHREVLRLLDKGPDGKTWYVQRQWYYQTGPRCQGAGQYCRPQAGEQGNPFYANSSVPAGGSLGMLSPGVYYNNNVTGIQLWWDTVNGAGTTDYSNTYTDPLPQGHPTYVNTPYGRWTYVAAQGMPGQEPARLTNPPAAIRTGMAGFNGIPASGGPALESHPSMMVTNPPDQLTSLRMSDAHPYMGCYDGCQVGASNVSLVAGQLYKIAGTNVLAMYKLISHFANSGSRAMREVSGPSAVLRTDSTTQLQWCVAMKAGECYSGSAAGEIYFNAPGIANAYCTNNWSLLQSTLAVPNDICVNHLSAYTQAIEERAVVNDPSGSFSRIISSSFGIYDGQSNFWNTRTLPDGSWLFAPVPDGGVKLFKIPPPDQSSEDRTAYVPFTVTIGGSGAPGASSAVVEFGYGENGPAGGYYCTARQETCVAQAGTINAAVPFLFQETEAAGITGMPCAAGCTITVPAIPGRILYYRVDFRDSNGKILSREPASAVAIP